MPSIERFMRRVLSQRLMMAKEGCWTYMEREGTEKADEKFERAFPTLPTSMSRTCRGWEAEAEAEGGATPKPTCKSQIATPESVTATSLRKSGNKAARA